MDNGGWDDVMQWTLFFQVLIIGFATGSLIALIALGYTLVYGIIELINFAHGEVFMMGAMFATTVVGWFGVTRDSSTRAIVGVLVVALVTSMIFSAAINVGIDRLGIPAVPECTAPGAAYCRHWDELCAPEHRDLLEGREPDHAALSCSQASS